MGKLLVEIDVSKGLLETLDIDWRGNFFSSKARLFGYSFLVFFVPSDSTFEKGL
jgi:hypothetical protein